METGSCHTGLISTMVVFSFFLSFLCSLCHFHSSSNPLLCQSSTQSFLSLLLTHPSGCFFMFLTLISIHSFMPLPTTTNTSYLTRLLFIHPDVFTSLAIHSCQSCHHGSHRCAPLLSSLSPLVMSSSLPSFPPSISVYLYPNPSQFFLPQFSVLFNFFFFLVKLLEVLTAAAPLHHVMLLNNV